jgi:hypothetical protein
MVVPKISGYSRAKHTRGIHRRASKRSPKQDVERDCRANDETGDAPRPPLIDCHSTNHEHERERKNSFDEYSLPRSEINRELWSASNDDIASKKTETNQSS